MSSSNNEGNTRSLNAVSTCLTFKGTRIYVHWTFWLLLSIHLALSILVYSWSVVWYALVLYGPFLFVTVWMHEISHAIVAYKLGGAADTIVLWPLGGLTIYGPDDKGPMGDFKVAIAGPLSHIVTGGVLAILYIVMKTSTMPPLTSMTVYLDHLESGFMGIISTACRVSFSWNVLLFFLHLIIPVFPLDGIRIWAGLMRIMGIRLTTTAKIISFAGMLVSLALFIYGCVKIFDRRIENGLTEILLGGLGLASSKLLYDMTRAGRLSEDPVFGRPCYLESSGSMTTSSVEIPTATIAQELDGNRVPAANVSTIPIESSEII
mmetsp:Transcript_1585/g.2893  ORF Transcript_1585/g.2893 Transcript_1585/m.2893 type:complete len:320 (-) Transcript_1585:2771-3730(-)